MGLFKKTSWAGQSPIPLGNPVPANFRIVRVETMGRFLAAEVHYPDAQNYEGKKILVFEDMPLQRLEGLKELDPHFRPHANSPIARFLPTERGWVMAKRFIKAMLRADIKE